MIGTGLFESDGHGDGISLGWASNRKFGGQASAYTTRSALICVPIRQSGGQAPFVGQVAFDGLPVGTAQDAVEGNEFGHFALGFLRIGGLPAPELQLSGHVGTSMRSGSVGRTDLGAVEIGVALVGSVHRRAVDVKELILPVIDLR